MISDDAVSKTADRHSDKNASERRDKGRGTLFETAPLSHMLLTQILYCHTRLRQLDIVTLPDSSHPRCGTPITHTPLCATLHRFSARANERHGLILAESQQQ